MTWEFNSQFLAGCGNDILIVRRMGVPLDISDIPGAALREKAVHSF